MYVLSTGCQWRAIPKDLPPKSTVYDYFGLWTYDGTLDRIHHAPYVRCREREQRGASPTAAIIDSQSVKSAVNQGQIYPGQTAKASKKSLSRPLTMYADGGAPDCARGRGLRRGI